MMFRKLLKQHFGIEAIENEPVGHYPSCKKDHQRYVLIPVDQKADEELAELDQIAVHLKKNGDWNVSTFLYTTDRNRLLETETGKYCVLCWDENHPRSTARLGRKLAKFHYRGRLISFPVQQINRIGQWKSLWEKRIDQMEKVWKEMIMNDPENEFDRMFFESFPYYMAIAENAIQYLVDTELDGVPQAIDNGTVCHVRFSNRTWENEFIMKNPFDWVLDHCGRDLAEWTRERYFNNYRTFQPEVERFYKDYQTVQPLSSFSWRLLYARLLFPLHYVECIENYYSTTSEQEQRLLMERLEKYLHGSSEHEKFLKNFYQMVNAPMRQQSIPVIEWM